MKIPTYKSIFLLFLAIFFLQNCKKPENLESKSTIDPQIQQVASSVLENQLKNFDAKSGSVLVMEVATGKVKAMVNLDKTDKGTFENSDNLLLNNYSEPGSVFMPVSLLIAINDGFVNEKTIIQTTGRWEYGGQIISDGFGFEDSTIGGILAHSSNVGIAKIITKNYENQPEKFYKYVEDWKFSEKLNDGTPNKSAPEITTPKDKNWSKPTLAGASYGYSLKISSLQIANFYNAIANHGKLMKPFFNENQKTEVLVDNIASDKSLQILTNALIESVEKGTPKSSFTENFKIAGKTGTKRLEYWKPGPAKYQASFVGFFPAENPKYTMYVSINEPKPEKSFYGATVASPVFKKIAGRILN